MKPAPQIHQLAAEGVDVALVEALFVDDMPPNVAGASAAGMAALYFSDPTLARTQLAQLTEVAWPMNNE